MPYEKIGNNDPVCIADEVPFDIPESWEWMRLGSLTYNHGQKKPENNFCYIDIGSIDNNCQKLADTENILSAKDAPSRARKIVQIGDILYSTVRPYLHNMCIVDKEFSCEPIASTGFAVLTTYADYNNDFLFFYMLSPDFDMYANCSENSKGVAYPAINDERLSKALIPIPPLAEQKKIINLIRLLLPQIEKYKIKEEKLTQLNTDFPEKLKKSVLQMAIQGKLVEQNPSDEPAKMLLQAIKNEKDTLIKAGKIKKDKNESIIYRRDNSYYEKIGHKELCIDDEIPFEIPETWEWTRLNNLVYFIGGYAYKSNEFIDASKYQVLRLGNVKNNCLKLETKPVFITEELAEQTKGFLCKQNDILITMTGTRGKRDYFFSVKIDDSNTNFYINQRVGCLRAFLPQLSNWLIWILKSETVLNQVFQHETGTANQGNLGAENIMKTLIPLPPENEQIQIIEKLYQISYFLQDK